MGVFDYIQLPFTCPKCGHFEPAEKRLWQTKSLDPALSTFKPGDRVFWGPRTGRNGDAEIHAGCPKCREFIVAFVLIENGKLTSTIEFPKEYAD